MKSFCESVVKICHIFVFSKLAKFFTQTSINKPTIVNFTLHNLTKFNIIKFDIVKYFNYDFIKFRYFYLNKTNG